jgi:hypothetical protein
MKSCPVCRKPLNDEYQFCPEDGSSLKDSALPGPSASQESVESSTLAATVPVSPFLYCPACSIEYPLTFSSCPVHGVTLSNKRPVVSIKRPLNKSSAIKQNDLRREDQPPSPPVVVLPPNLTATECQAVEVIDDDYIVYNQEQDPFAARPAKPSHRIAALLTAIGLISFSLFSAYIFYSKAGRGPLNRTAEVTQAPLVIKVPENLVKPTEESPSEESEQEPPYDEKVGAREGSVEQINHQQTHAVRTSEPDSQIGTTARPTVKNTPVATQVRAASAQLPQLPPPVSSRAEARLVRVRSIRTGSGYQYEMTFSLQDIAGQVTQWERLIIATHSASGANRNQVLPFFHRLGASGALTFTVSVEMAGRTEADWRGRVICTGIGSDNQGRSYRASFGATVAP